MVHRCISFNRGAFSPNSPGWAVRGTGLVNTLFSFPCKTSEISRMQGQLSHASLCVHFSNSCVRSAWQTLGIGPFEMLTLPAPAIGPCKACRVMTGTVRPNALAQRPHGLLRHMVAPLTQPGFSSARRSAPRRFQCRAGEPPFERQEATMREELSNFEAERDASLYAGIPPPLRPRRTKQPSQCNATPPAVNDETFMQRAAFKAR